MRGWSGTAGGAVLAVAAGLAAGAAPAAAQTGAIRPDQAAFRALYKEFVETDTSVTTGSCTALADKVEGHLRAAGYTDAEITRFAVPEYPAHGEIVAVLPGTSKTSRPMLLLGHLDVVVAKREDWTRNPYEFIEEGDYFYGRGTQDMKAMDAIWTDMMIRFRRSGYKPGRTIKLALTCGEEGGPFNGARWLTENRRALIDAEFALNEGGGGRSDGHGKIEQARLHVGEKTVATFRIEATNPGGHSSAPIRDNAIYELSDALIKLREFDFPLMLSDTTRAFFTKLGAAGTDPLSQAMTALMKNPADKEAEAALNADKSYHSMLRTTCVATMVDAGHAVNALPQRATATVNCRVFPGVPVAQVRETLIKVIADPRMTVSAPLGRGAVAQPPPLDPRIVGPAEKMVAKYFPGVPLVPFMATGATDGVFLEAVGIPSYGPPGIFGDPDGNGTHGLNERALVQAVYTGRDLLTDLVKEYAAQ